MCNDCKQIVCGKHALPGDHECRGKTNNRGE
ncbi:MAG: AN1-type zinc finger domain-containing protein [Candidatus Hodarchaeales archaeon]